MTPDRTITASLRMFRWLPVMAAGALLSLACGGSAQTPVAPSTQSNSASTASWNLTWSDEFNGADGSSPDASKWVAQTGGDGWGNQELEYYTANANALQQGGNLVITAAKQHYTGTDGVSREYTSARLQTKGLFAQKYGRFEARIKLPKGQGIWPAFWMLGDDIDTAGWPAAGEIDIMESVGSKPSTVLGTLHGPGYSGAHPLTANYALPSGSFDTDFHLYAVEWEPQQIRFYVDNALYETRSLSDIPQGSKWVFDHPFFILLNVAVGGNLPGSPDSTTVFPQKMLVDYVRVYQKK